MMGMIHKLYATTAKLLDKAEDAYLEAFARHPILVGLGSTATVTALRTCAGAAAAPYVFQTTSNGPNVHELGAALGSCMAAGYSIAYVLKAGERKIIKDAIRFHEI